MTGLTIFITTLDEELAAADAVGEQLINAWPGAEPPAVRTVCGNSLEPEDLDKADALIMVTSSATGQAPALALLTTLEESNVPVLALLEEDPAPGNIYEYAGAVALPRSADPVAIASIVQGLAHRQPEMRKLRSEVNLAHRYHGGLRGEINKMQEELQLAAMVQREFLPRELPEVHGLSFAAMWRPAHYVSGDLYDVIRLDEDHVGMFVADAIGHGVPAALMTMVICRSLAVKEVTGSSYRIVPPAEVLDRLNHHLIKHQGRTTRFATAVYIVINCRKRTMRVAGAGHPPPVLMHTDGTTDMIETSGGLLGVFAQETFDQVEVELQVDDRLVLYSDGFEQAFPNPDPTKDQQLPTTQYLDEFQRLRAADDPDDMVRCIEQRLDDQFGSLNQVDDLTFLCMQAAALPAPTSERERSRSAAG